MRVAMAVLVCGCAAAALDESPVLRRDAILGGTTDSTTTAVYVLDLRYDNNKAAICSAVLVSPKVLLSAGHCVDPSREGATSMAIRATNKSPATMLSQSETIVVDRYERHPSYAGEGAHDLSLLLLHTAPANVTPFAVLRSEASLTVGATLRHVGFGRASASDGTSAGTRRSVTVAVSQLSSELIDSGQEAAVGTCIGDSGGPGLLRVGGAEYVAGITSYGTSRCGAGSDVRVDTNLAFIDDFIARYDPAPCTVNPNGPGCAPPCATSDGSCSSDCSVKDPDCLADGDVCTAPTQCATRLCQSDPRGFSFCSRTCLTSETCERMMVCDRGVCSAPPVDAGVEADGGPQTDVPFRGGCSAVAGEPVWVAWAMLFSAWAFRRRRAPSESRPSSSPRV